MTDNETLAIATRMYVRLRQHAGRVIDAVWMSQNLDYAREILHLCRLQADPELGQLADRFEAAAFGRMQAPQSFNPGASGLYPAAPQPSSPPLAKYLRSLR